MSSEPERLNVISANVPTLFERITCLLVIAGFGMTLGCGGTSDAPQGASTSGGSTSGTASGSGGVGGAGGAGGSGGAGGTGGGGGGGGGSLDPVCVCDREIAAGESDVDLSALAPGSVVCLRPLTGGTPRGPLKLHGAKGTAVAPVVVRNCDGLVHIESTTNQSALRLDGSYVRVTGAGAAGVEHGLLLSAAQSAAALAVGHADHFEIDNFEIDASNFAGVMAKVDPSSTDCKVGDRRFDTFVMDGAHLHDAYIHDIEGEGIYLGNSFYTGASTQYCGGNAACDLSPCGGVQYPHEVRSVRIHGVRVQNSSLDGIQVGSAVNDCEVFDNEVRQFGTKKTSNQDHGIQIGLGSSCRVYRNLIVNGPNGINLQGIGGIDAVNNVVAGVTGFAIIVNPRPTPLATDIVAEGYVGGFRLLHNTLFAPGDNNPIIRDVNVPNAPVPTQGNVIQGNLIVAGPSWLQISPKYQWAQAANLRFASAMEAKLLDPANDDFCLTPGAAGVDAAPNASGLGVTHDFHLTPRPLGNGYDVGALECQ
jgi:hypothetical protein